jgi:hypothetical protein
MAKIVCSLKPLLSILSFFLLLCVLAESAQAQKKKLSFKDSVDKKFDMSDYIIDLHGFIPVPILITEPALGGFGGGIAPVFIRKNNPYIDTVDGKVKVTPVSPNITGGVGLYTVNGTWFTALFKGGTLVKSRIKYRMGNCICKCQYCLLQGYTQYWRNKIRS